MGPKMAENWPQGTLFIGKEHNLCCETIHKHYYIIILLHTENHLQL